MSVIRKTTEEINAFKSQPTIKHMTSFAMPVLSEKAPFVAVPTTSSSQSNQVLLINNDEGKPVSDILLQPSDHSMLKFNQKQFQSESDPDSDYESTSKFFLMNKYEKKMFHETFFCTLLDFMHEIVKDGHVVSSSDPIWERISLKLGNIIKPKSIYNRVILDIQSCRTRLFKEYLMDPKSRITDSSALNPTQKTSMHPREIKKKSSHVDHKTFNDALFAFKDQILINGMVASRIDLVWNQISAYLNYAIKPNSVYLRFKRNKNNCYQEFFAQCRIDPSKVKTYDVSSVKLPLNRAKKKNLKFKDSSKFFEALYIYRKKIIQNGCIAKCNNSVWNDVAKILDYALQPTDIYSKFNRNHDLCQTKLIELCKRDKNFTPIITSKLNKSNCVSDDEFFSLLCKYRDEILQDGNKIAKFSHPIWAQISKDLNGALKPGTVYFRVTRNSQLCLNRLLKPAELLTDFIHKDGVSNDNFIEVICLYKYSIMNCDQVVDLSDPVWNEISLRLNSTLTPKEIFDAISQDKDLCKTKMIQALKTECSVFSGENTELSENITELTPIVECNITNESNDDFNEIVNEFKTSIIQPNGQMALKDDPVWTQISSCLKNMKSDEVYLQVVNNNKNCQTQFFNADSVDKNQLFDALFKHRFLVLYNNVIANINDEVWTKISKELNCTLTPVEIYKRFIDDVNGCRTELSDSLKKHLTHIQVFDKEKFIDAIIDHKDKIFKNGLHAESNDPVWREIESKLNFEIKPLTIYNNFVANKYNCKQKLLEACELNKNNSLLISSKIIAQMDHDYTKGGVDHSFQNVTSIGQKCVGYVHEDDFTKACLVFKDRLIKNNCLASSTDEVWNDISKHLNNAILPRTVYMRFKRNTHKCQEKLYGIFNELSYERSEESCSAEDKRIENEMYFDAISIFKHSIINYGNFALNSSPVWIDVSNVMKNLLTPDEAYYKFRKNIDLCRTKLINSCLIDWSKESHIVTKNRIHLIESKELSWNETLNSEQLTNCINETNNTKSCVHDDEFYDAIYKHKSHIFLNDLVANCTDPVWVAIAKELNNKLEPSAIHSRFKNNMSKCKMLFSEAAQRHNLYKSKQKQLIDENSNDSYDMRMVIDSEDEQIVEYDTIELRINECNLDHETTIL